MAAHGVYNIGVKTMPIIDLERMDLPAEFSCDVAIIGAGAVGIAMAAELARKGHDVILIEAGGANLETRSQNIFNNARSSGFKLEGLHSGRFRLLGGTTKFWGGQLVPFDPIVFEDRPWARCDGWPFGRATLDPYYDRAMTLLKMDGAEATDAAVWARAGTSPPDLQDELELFLTRWIKTPNFAKHFQADLLSPKIKTLLHANVCGFELNASGRRIERVHMRRFDGSRASVSARYTVLACGTIEISRLLLLPDVTGRKTPWSDNPWLGRAYIDHLDTTAGDVIPKNRKVFSNLFENMFFDGYKYNPKIKLTEEAQREHQLLGVAGAMIFRTSYEENAQNLKLFIKSILSGKLEPGFWQMPMHAIALWKVAIPLAYRYFRSNRTFHPSSAAVFLRVTSEQIPLRESRITLRPERDALDMPMVDVKWAVDGAELETIAAFAERVRDALHKADLAEVRLDPALVARDPAYLAKAEDTYHQMGGARMGATAQDGVVDANLRVHGVEGLYVAGAAVMPSSGFPNCTLTAIALGIRLCDHLTKDDAEAEALSVSVVTG
jgi:choline dehydrogenase-like flavoprotein